MRVYEESFDLKRWRRKLGISQGKAAKMLGMSLSAYCTSEYRQQDRKGNPVRRQTVILCKMYQSFHSIGQDPISIYEMVMNDKIGKRAP